MSADAAVLVATALAAVGSLVLAAELIQQRRELRAAFAWDVLETQYAGLLKSPVRAGIARRLLDGPAFDASLALRVPLAIAAVALTVAGNPLAGLTALGLVLLNVTLHARLLYGLDGSDQMATIVWAGLAAYWLAPSGWAQSAALAFVGAQFALAYITSGVAKAISPQWRGGEALPGIFSSGNHGLGAAATLVGFRPVALAACWVIIAVEALGPPLAFLHPAVLAVFTALAAAFHLGVALTMGLNLFFWSFLASLACFVWLATQAHGVL